MKTFKRTHVRQGSKSGSGDWSNLTERRYLANVSSELFSSSGLFLGLDLNLNSQVSNGYTPAFPQGNVSVPPGIIM